MNEFIAHNSKGNISGRYTSTASHLQVIFIQFTVSRGSGRTYLLVAVYLSCATCEIAFRETISAVRMQFVVPPNTENVLQGK